MFKNQRHHEILTILKEENFASVASLAERLYASQPTIRRDLEALEKQGFIRRSHGGAMPADDRINTPLSFRSGKHTAEKLRICRAAARFVPQGALIFTDASTTALSLADTLRADDRICVLTNGYPACKLFSDKGFRVFSTGGRLLSDSQAFVGDRACENVTQYHADVMLFSSSSLSCDGEVTDYSEEETALRRTMLRHAERKIFLCDSGKFHSHSAFRLCSLSDVDLVITGAPLDDDTLLACGLELLEQNEAFVYRRK